MRTIKLYPVVLALAASAVAACEDGTDVSLFDEEEVTADLAVSSGEAIATSIAAMVVNELTLEGTSNARMPALAMPHAVEFSRSRTCYDAGGNVVDGCRPVSSVRMVVTNVAIEGSRSGTHSTEGGGSRSWSGVAHRSLVDTLTRNFNSDDPPVEQSRTHTAIGTANDTVTFANDQVSRFFAENAVDSVKAVTWNVPRGENPFPVSGSFVRVVNVHATVTRGEATETRDFARRITVQFPADAQGNVVLTINDMTCNLNLVTRSVTDCE